MAFDGVTVAALTKEIGERVMGGRLYKINQPEPDEILLTIKAESGRMEKLLISAGASLPFAYFTEKSFTNPISAPVFCMVLRKHVQNGRIVGVEQPGLERIIRITIEHMDELGDKRRKTIVAEFMGKHSNIIFVDQNETVIDSIKRINASISRVREVLPGRPYFIPQTMEKLSIFDCLEEGLFEEKLRKGNTDLIKALYNGFTGLSPVMASELIFRAGMDGTLSTAALDKEDIHRLFLSFEGLVRDIEAGSFSHVIVYERGVPREFSAIELSQYGGSSSPSTGTYFKRLDSISEVLELYFAEKNQVTRIRQKASDLRRIVTSAKEKCVRKLLIQEKQLKDTEKRDKYRIYGEMLNTYGYGLPEGAKELSCVNFYTNEPIKVPLDPLITPKENAKKYFDRYAKLKRTREAVTEQLEVSRNELSYLESVEASLDIATDEADLKDIREELVRSGNIRKRGFAGKDKPKKREKSQPLHFKSSDGYDIYVGKNNFQNDELTFKIASPSDWWFHSKSFPGSHVIMKVHGDKMEDIPDRAFNEAGAAAAYYSKGREQGKVDIDYVIRKEVKKPAGSNPGFVVYYTNYSMSIAPDISYLEPLED
ncbi:MAG: NFACT family protein [Lachnospiraceae bacterium]|nr:NFACT family protein [Lachnospiraceae bacterium]